MKKIITLITSALFAMTMLTSCVTAEAAGVAVEAEYYDYGWNYVVVYIDGIANYRFWDDLHHRYWYRVVPHERYNYIRMRPHNHHVSHRHMRPRHPRPDYRPDGRPHAPRPDSHHRSSTYHQQRPQSGPSNVGRPSSSGLTRPSGRPQSGHFGGHRR